MRRRSPPSSGRSRKATVTTDRRYRSDGRRRRMDADRRLTSVGSLGTAFVLLALLSCGGGSGSSGPAGVPRAATIPSLDTTQSAVLCDWVNQSLGGYGSIDNCDGGGSRHADSTPQ